MTLMHRTGLLALLYCLLPGDVALGQSYMPESPYPPAIHEIPGPHPAAGIHPFPGRPTVPHLVLESPRPQKPGHPGMHGHTGMNGHVQSGEPVMVDEFGNVIQNHQPREKGTYPHEVVHDHFLHADKMTPPPAIPQASRVPVWKTPYSYGHFGASRTRQWSFHRGHQEGYTQWTLR